MRFRHLTLVGLLSSFAVLSAGPRVAHAEEPAVPLARAPLADRGSDMRLALVFGIGGSYYGTVDTGLEMQRGWRYPGQSRLFVLGRVLLSKPMESGPSGHVSLVAGVGAGQRLCYRHACLVGEARTGLMGTTASDVMGVVGGRAGIELGGPRGLFGLYLGLGWRQALVEDDDHSGDSSASGAEASLSIGGGHRW